MGPAFSATTPEVERLALHEVSDTHPELKDGGLPQNQQYKDNLRVKILDVVFVSPTRAAVQYGSSSRLSGHDVHAQRRLCGVDRQRVEGLEETTCGLIAQGGRPVPRAPRPARDTYPVGV